MQNLSSKKWKCGKQKRIGENMYLHIGKDEMIKKEHKHMTMKVERRVRVGKPQTRILKPVCGGF